MNKYLLLRQLVLHDSLVETNSTPTIGITNKTVTLLELTKKHTALVDAAFKTWYCIC